MPEGDKQYQLPNRKLPRIKSTFSPVLASVINELAEAIEGMPEHRKIKVGKGLLMDENRSTTIIKMGATPSPVAKWYPFKLYQQNATNKPLEVSVFYGTINSFVPVIRTTRFDVTYGTPINGSEQKSALASPGGGGLVANAQNPDHPDFIPDTAPWVTAGDADGEYQIWLKWTPLDPCASSSDAVQGDDNHPMDVQIGAQPLDEDVSKRVPPNPDRVAPEQSALDTNGVMPLSYPGTGYVEIGRVTVKNEAITKINNSLTHSLMHTSCGIRHYFWGV